MKNSKKTMPLAVSATLLALLAACAGPQNAAAPAPAATATGAWIARNECATCHGATGVTASPVIPHLAAQQPEYLMEQLANLKARHRRDLSGYQFTGTLTEGDIRHLADYYSQQKPAAPAKAVDAAAIEAGRVLFTEGDKSRGVVACRTCHGDAGLGNGKFPRLANQQPYYIVKQLTIFEVSDDKRAMGNVMTTVAHKLQPKDLEPLSAYIASM